MTKIGVIRGRIWAERDCLLKLLDSLIHLSGLGQLPAESIVGVRDIRSKRDCLPQVLESVLNLALFGEHHSHFHLRFAIGRIKGQRFLPVCHGSVRIAG